MIEQLHDRTKTFSSTPCEQSRPSERAAFLDAACGDDAAAARTSRGTAAMHIEQSASFLGIARRRRVAPTIDQPLTEQPRHPHRPLQAAGANRRRGHGRRLCGRADRAGPPPRGAEDHQAGHGHQAGDRPLRGRAASPGDDGPSEHRQGARCRNDRSRPPLLRDGAGPRHADHRVLRQGTS